MVVCDQLLTALAESREARQRITARMRYRLRWLDPAGHDSRCVFSGCDAGDEPGVHGYVRIVPDYVIRGGNEGYERLLLLARDRRSDTLALFSRAGIHAGQRCADVGCGGGEVSFDLARLADPETVVGIDIDETKLDRARRVASERRITNVEFHAADVTVWNEPSNYDVVYSRFLLQHLADPIAMLHTYVGRRPPRRDAGHRGHRLRRLVLPPPVRGFRVLRAFL